MSSSQSSSCSSFLRSSVCLCFSHCWCRLKMASVCQAITWQRSQFTSSRLAADLCLVSSPPYSADGGGGAAASVITENCCVGGNRCVNSTMAERREEGVCLCLRIECVLGFNMNPKQPYSCSGLGQFEAHSEMSHTHQLPTVWGWFWPGVNCLSPLNIIQCHMPSACPVNVLKLAHCWNINLLRESV